ncbi:hypothetical protein DK26_01645, partial [Bosea sp. WAO]|uniref:VCBS domain-containing protein n=1 Tax=Bosea sp. WAO TaxID=406341 RepID=UPI0007496CF7
ATLTITITGRTDGAPTIVPADMNGAVSGENSVSERGLGDTGDASETTTGAVTVAAPDGLSTVTVGGRVITLAELQALGTTPITVTTPKGVLTINGFTPGTTVGGVPVSGELSYSYTLTTAQDHRGGAVSDVFALAIGDAGGGTATGSLTIAIADDAPQARNDVATIEEDTPSVAGNVITTGAGADRVGADGATVTEVGFGATTGAVGSALSGAYGALTLNADGSYSYALDNDNAAVSGLRDGETLTEVFTYRITDADGDVSTATLTITITGRNEPPAPILPDRDAGAGMLPGRLPGAGFVELGANSYLEGRPYDRYLTFGQVVSQQVLFRMGGTSTPGTLHYEAALGIDQPLPSWISFDPSLQLVTARPTRDVPPGLYLVRVTARDSNGNYAESSVSFRILRDIDEAVRELRAAVPAIDLPNLLPAGGELPEPGSDGETRRDQPVRQEPEQEAPSEQAPDKQARSSAPTAAEAISAGNAALSGEGQRPSRSLTQSLINSGLAGQMIEAARLLEALTPERPPRS